MPEAEQAGRDQSRDVNPVYRPSEDGAIVLYAGDLQLAIGADEHVMPGNLEFRLSPRSEFSAHVAGSDPWLVMHAWDSQRMTVALPAGAELDPPTDRVPTARPEGAFPWADIPMPITRMTTGELRLSERLLLHVSGPLSRWPLPSRETDDGEQAQQQLCWSLSGGICASRRPAGQRQWTTSLCGRGDPARPSARSGRHGAARGPGVPALEPDCWPRDRRRTGGWCGRRRTGGVGRLGRSPLPA